MAVVERRIEFHSKQISMAHGAGGEASRQLVEGLFQPAFSNALLDPLGDAAILSLTQSGRLAVTSDSFVVRPLRFPGGSIGELAINGTVNDLAVSGAKPLAITAAFILEAGLPSEVLREEVRAMALAAQRANVQIVTGDTKVVEHGRADGLYISTTGIGVVDPRIELGAARVEIGDQVILSGPIGNHGMAIMLARAELEIESEICSDTRPLVDLVSPLVARLPRQLKWMRDATRGGVATVLNELARDTRLSITLEEEAIPIDDPVRGACELLGLDPLQVANEGQFIAVVGSAVADAALNALHAVSGGQQACVIGEVTPGPLARVVARSAYGGTRVVDMLIGDPLPRIC